MQYEFLSLFIHLMTFKDTWFKKLMIITATCAFCIFQAIIWCFTELANKCSGFRCILKRHLHLRVQGCIVKRNQRAENNTLKGMSNSLLGALTLRYFYLFLLFALLDEHKHWPRIQYHRKIEEHLEWIIIYDIYLHHQTISLFFFIFKKLYDLLMIA